MTESEEKWARIHEQALRVENPEVRELIDCSNIMEDVSRAVQASEMRERMNPIAMTDEEYADLKSITCIVAETQFVDGKAISDKSTVWRNDGSVEIHERKVSAETADGCVMRGPKP